LCSYVRFPAAAVNDVATAAAATSIVTATSRAYGRHSSESDVDTPPKVDAPPLFEASPKGFCYTTDFMVSLLLTIIYEILYCLIFSFLPLFFCFWHSVVD